MPPPPPPPPPPEALVAPLEDAADGAAAFVAIGLVTAVVGMVPVTVFAAAFLTAVTIASRDELMRSLNAAVCVLMDSEKCADMRSAEAFPPPASAA
jgi:hypothetical protein